MTRIPLFAVLLALAAAAVLRCGSVPEQAQVSIPLPEHPRPDFMRSEWINLNGPWSFALDSLDVGMNENWQSGETPFPLTITVPFSWAAPLSGIGRKDVHNAWYACDISVPSAWKDKRVYLVIAFPER